MVPTSLSRSLPLSQTRGRTLPCAHAQSTGFLGPWEPPGPARRGVSLCPLFGLKVSVRVIRRGEHIISHEAIESKTLASLCAKRLSGSQAGAGLPVRQRFSSGYQPKSTAPCCPKPIKTCEGREFNAPGSAATVGCVPFLCLRALHGGCGETACNGPNRLKAHLRPRPPGSLALWHGAGPRDRRGRSQAPSRPKDELRAGPLPPFAPSPSAARGPANALESARADITRSPHS